MRLISDCPGCPNCGALVVADLRTIDGKRVIAWCNSPKEICDWWGIVWWLDDDGLAVISRSDPFINPGQSFDVRQRGS